MNRRHLAALLLALAVAAPAAPARAEDLVWAMGRVFSADGKRPLAGATVAVYNDKNEVVDYARTDEEGSYAIAVPRNALHLNKKSGGFMHRVAGLVGGAGRIAAYPLKAGIKVAQKAVEGSDPITKVGVGAVGGLAERLLGSGRKGEKPMLERTLPGVVVMKVTAPGHGDAVSLARVYWMEEQVLKAGGREQKSLAAWLDPFRMSVPGSERPSQVYSEYLTFADARMEPSIAEPGQTVRIVVSLPAPPEPRTPFVVVARNDRTGQFYELTPAGGERYQAEFTVDKKFPKNDQVFTVLAYAQQDDTPGRDKKVEDALKGAGLFDAKKPFVYNPLLVVSRNRAELVLTVVQPGKRR